jgi:hypothetical protein
MVGAANSDSARISFFGSTKGELAQKLDRGKDAAGRRRLTQVPPEPREMVAYYTAHKLCLGWGYLLFVGGTAHAGPRFAAWTSYAFPTECNGTQLSSAEPKGKNRLRRTVEYSQEAFVVRKGPNGRPCSEVH